MNNLLKSKIKHLLQKKNIFEYKLLIDQIVNGISYSSKKEFLANCAINSGKPGITDTKYCNNEIIVSLTTYGDKLYEVYLAIESIMQQTYKPNKIVLWISEELKGLNLPVFLSNQVKRGLEIKYCKDIGSYKKLIPSLKEYPDASIITIDDDALYQYDLMENLINEHNKYPNLIVCGRMHLIKMLNKNKIAKYKNWKQSNNSTDISPLVFPTGVGGVLYPPHCFNDEVFNEPVFFSICKYADDIWFKAMSLLNNVSSKKIFTHNKNGYDYYSNDFEDDFEDRLVHINIDKGMNDIQFKAVFDKYNLYDKLKT